MSGGGSVSLVNGVAYGEPYESVNVDLTAQGQDIEASRMALRLHGMAINGNGGYDLGSKHSMGTSRATTWCSRSSRRCRTRRSMRMGR